MLASSPMILATSDSKQAVLLACRPREVSAFLMSPVDPPDPEHGTWLLHD